MFQNMQVPGNPNNDVYRPPRTPSTGPELLQVFTSEAKGFVAFTEWLHTWKYLKEDTILSHLGPRDGIYA